MEIDAKVIEAVWEALHEPAPTVPPPLDGMNERIIKTGWTSTADVDGYLLLQDRRLDRHFVVDPKTWATALGLPFRFAFPRPERRHDDCRGFEMLSASDTAALFIYLERLGFRIDVTDLCARIRPRLMTTTHLTDEEISVFFYEDNRHRTPPITISAPHGEWRGMNIARFKTSSGYRVEYAFDDDDRALWLTVFSPKYRKRPDPVLTVCPDCGMTYLKGSRTDDQSHRSFHRQRLAIIEPKPHRRFAEALDRDLDAAWVDASAPQWKRKEVHGRALEFKRELGYDFVQWGKDAVDDPSAVGFLFADDCGRIVGACAFRPRSHGSERPWRLDWIWICPDARRQGHLDRQWGRFRQQFGVFDVEPPLSDAMQAFLRKRGCGDLIR